MTECKAHRLKVYTQSRLIRILLNWMSPDILIGFEFIEPDTTSIFTGLDFIEISRYEWRQFPLHGPDAGESYICTTSLLLHIKYYAIGESGVSLYKLVLFKRMQPTYGYY